MERYSILRAKRFVNKVDGKPDKVVYAFDMSDDIIKAHYYKLRLHQLDDGTWFIAFPAYENQGTGKFYKYYWLDLKDYEKDIINEVIKLANAD